MAKKVLRFTALAFLMSMGLGTAAAQTLPDTTKIYMQMASVDISGNLRASIHISGYGQPGNQSARGYGGFLLMSLSPPPDPTMPIPFGVLLPLSYVGETGGADIAGQPNKTRLYFFIRYTNDQLFFEDDSPMITNSGTKAGRTGNANLQIPTGTFRNAVGGVAYTFQCGQGCPMPDQTIQDGPFDGALSGTMIINLPTNVAQVLFPHLFGPPLPIPPQVPTPPVATQNGNGMTVLSAEQKAGILGQLVRREDTTGGGPTTPFFTVTPTLQTTGVTYTATATCANLPSGCWLSAPSPSGSISAFNTASIPANYSLSGIPAGVYPADFAVAITSDPSVPAVVQDAQTTLVVAAAPALQISEQALHFLALAAQGSQSHVLQIATNSSQSTPWTATASTLSGNNWLTVSAGSGTASPASSLTVSANPAGLAAGDYFGRVDIASSGASSSPQSVVVQLTVSATGSEPVLSSTGLVFVSAANANPAPQSLQITTLSTAPIPITAGSEKDDGMEWFSIHYSAFSVGASAPVTLTVTPTAAGLTPGVYTGTVTVKNGNDLSLSQISIVLVVTPSAGQCTPTQLLPVVTNLATNFDVPSGAPVSVQAQIVDDCGTPLTAASGAVQALFPADNTATVMTATGGGQWSGTWEPVTLAGGPAVVTVNAQASSGLQGSATVTGKVDANSTAPVINTAGIVSAASLGSGIVAPGEFISIFGSNLGPASPAQAQSFPLKTTLGGVQVLLGGQALPLQIATSGQINAVVPFGAAINGTQQLIVARGNTYSMPQSVIVASDHPAVFTQAQSGKGAGVIVVVKANATQFVNTASAPASAGDALTIYCAGLGAVNPPVADGTAAPLTQPFPQTVDPLTVTVGGKPAQVLFSGLAPGFAGLYQVNVVVPSGVASGPSIPVVITAGGFPSPPVTVAIQ